jgi:protein-arginine kinase activator protein McsA
MDECQCCDSMAEVGITMVTNGMVLHVDLCEDCNNKRNGDGL